ncbi:hypothetical protein PCYB_021210 [Plasmodium cynomolgi strain B]|uniref:Phist protein n=1 Tax=Plasmodium cynomolgi (strain B) TaxID=1120755 RepID=K6V644_PLACD|nr:hypothetical protein PCYB_021210 [Plasmodium cynomolgi strain B]GAB64552.1 hypothetical protein PCYB_021210 [Plasmodium cynomolgi strain B]
MSTVMLVLNIVALVLVFWQPPCSYDLKHPVNRSSDGCKQTGKRAERVLEAEHTSPFEECGQLFGPEDVEMEDYVTLISTYPVNNVENEEVYTEQPNNVNVNVNVNVNDAEFLELFNRVNTLWNETVENMVNEYITYTDSNHMEISWRDEMWNQRWYKYLESIHSDLNKFINDETLTYETREHIAEDLLYWANDDFKWFLNIVKEEWDHETTSRSEVLVSEV